MAEKKKTAGETKEVKPAEPTVADTVEISAEELAALKAKADEAIATSTENTALKEKLADLKEELAALKVVSEVTEPVKLEIPSEEARTVKYEGKKYRFIPQTYIWISGVKTLVTSAAKDDKIIKALVDNESTYLQKLI